VPDVLQKLSKPMILKQKNGKRWKKQYPVIINSENSYAIYLIKVIVTPTETLYLCSIRIELISHNKRQMYDEINVKNTMIINRKILEDKEIIDELRKEEK
jgi:hypothetical protein